LAAKGIMKEAIKITSKYFFINQPQTPKGAFKLLKFQSVHQ
jgi:hypothetical protein